MPPVISVEHLSKAYRLGQIGTGTFANDLKVWWAKMRGKPNPLLKIGQEDHGNRDGEIIWALKDVSFTVEQGEVLGVIGRNGAGKSTLLKILSRITAPTEGVVKVKGRIASLLEVGTGFHPELTGRENIYLNGAILGMSRKEIDRKFDEIVAFAEIEPFIDTPVKRYSSGMYVRLAFAVAAHLDAEILLVDEVLAVGDAAFQKKCLGKMSDVASQEGRTVLFVSHNMAAVSALCLRTILVNHGRIKEQGDSNSIINSYLSLDVKKSAEFYYTDKKISQKKRGVHLIRVSIKNSFGKVLEQIPGDRSFFCEIEYFLEEPISNFRIGFRLIDSNGIVVFTSTNRDGNEHLVHVFKPGRYISRCKIQGNLLSPGRYYVTATCDIPMQEVIFVDENIVSFEISDIGSVGSLIPDNRVGIIRPQLKWETYTIYNPMNS